MSIYISSPKKRKGKYHLWVSMVSDMSLEELRTFAQKMNLRRSHFKKDHYEFSSRKYDEAIRRGAIEIEDLDKYNCLK